MLSKQSMTFTTNGTGDCSAPDYEWSIKSDIGSAIDQNGNYNAGLNRNFLNEATDVVSVVDHGNGGITAEATVNVSWRCCLLLPLYGENSEEIEVLRKFRDSLLSQTPAGQEIIRLYYEWSPVIVKAMETDEEFKEELKDMIDGLLPLVR